MNNQFDEEFLERLTIERDILEDKIEKARFGYIVSRKQYYRGLIKEMEELNVKLSERLDATSNLFNDVLRVDLNKALIADKLYEIIENSIKVDGLSI